MRQHERDYIFELYQGMWLCEWEDAGNRVEDAPHDIMMGFAFEQSMNREEHEFHPEIRLGLALYRCSDVWKKNDRRERGRESMQRFRQARKKLRAALAKLVKGGKE